MKILKTLILFSTAALWAAGSLAAMSAEEIVRKRDENEHLDSARVQAEMRIISRGRETEKRMETLISGDNSLTEFTNPRDRGTRFLKRGQDLFLFFPDAEDIVRISGHMLNQGMMGSDWSYRDIMESDKFIELYDYEITGREEFEGRDCYILEGTAKEGADVSYYRRVSWIDSERFICLKEELYARGGRLLKEYFVTETREIQGRWYPLRAVMENRVRADSRTVFEVESIDFEAEIPEETFSIERLRK